MNALIRLPQLAALTLITVLATAAQAQSADTYQVEAIVFAQPSGAITGNRSPEPDWADNAVMLESTARSDVRRLDDTQHRMDREADKLRAQGYQILMHKAWTQPLDNSLEVAVHEGESLGEHYPVEALVGLERGQDSLVLDARAWRHTPVGGDSQSSRIASEQLHQSRRIRLDEVHYLDHQSMGMLVRVTRR